MDTYGGEFRTLRERLDQRFVTLRTEQQYFKDDWRLIQRFVSPYRGQMEPTDRRAGTSKRREMINNTAAMAVRTCANGLSSNLINPASQWFKIAPEDDELEESGKVREWLDFLERKINKVLNRSGFYAAGTEAMTELATFGTSALASSRDFETLVSWEAWTIGPYFLATDARGLATTAYREWQVPVEQIVATFGLERCSFAIREQYDRGNPDGLRTIRHAIEPWSMRFKNRPELKRWPFVSLYWDPADEERERFLRIGGFSKCPVKATRWQRLTPMAYGIGPVHLAIGDTTGLQVTEKKLVRGIERKMGSGGWQGPAAGFQGGGLNALNQGENDYNPVAGLLDIRPLIDPRSIQLADAQWYHERLEERIKETCFVNLFAMFAESDRRQMTATESLEKAKEKALLGPVLHQINVEMLDPAIDDVATMLIEESRPFWEQGEPGMLPLPPDELQGQDLKIEHISDLQQAQRMGRAEPIYRLAAFVAEFGQIDPTLPMKVDLHQCADELGAALGVPAKVIRDDETVRMMLEEQQAAQQEQMAMQQQQLQAETINKLGNASTEPGTALGDLQQAEAG